MGRGPLATALGRSGAGFALRTADGSSIEAQHVVVATGIRSHRYVPQAVRALGAECVTHSWDAGGIARLEGGRLLVVGGGQSAAEACAYLAARNRVTWVHRSAITLFTEPIGLPRPLYEAARAAAGQLFRLPGPLRAALSDTFTKSTVTPELRRPLSRARIRRLRTDVNRVGLHRENGAARADALEETYDHVVACTGYRCALRSLGFLGASLRREIAARAGQPVLGPSFETSVPGLFMIGALAEPSHGAAQRFMIGCGDTTVRVAAAISAR